MATGLLSELGRKFETDKVDYHSYLPFYEKLFAERKVKRLLEIGIFKGASLRMWEEYLPEAEIYGFDIDKTTLINEGRIKSFVADQRDKISLLEAVYDTGVTGFDVIIDDAFHEPKDQIFCANVMMKFVEPGGVYVIEDIRAGNKGIVQVGLNYPSYVVEFETERLADDRIIIIER